MHSVESLSDDGVTETFKFESPLERLKPKLWDPAIITASIVSAVLLLTGGVFTFQLFTENETSQGWIVVFLSLAAGVVLPLILSQGHYSEALEQAAANRAWDGYSQEAQRVYEKMPFRLYDSTSRARDEAAGSRWLESHSYLLKQIKMDYFLNKNKPAASRGYRSRLYEWSEEKQDFLPTELFADVDLKVLDAETFEVSVSVNPRSASR